MRIFLSLLAVSLFFAACDKCRKITCENGQPCEDGACVCSQWFEGELCRDTTVQGYSGIYEGEFTCAGSEGDDRLEIQSTNLTNVLMMEVSGSEVEMHFSDIHHFELVPETVQSPIGDYTVSGEGSITGNVLTAELRYELEEGNGSMTCVLDMHK